MAFVGIEFCTEEVNDSGSLAIVHSQWLTPRKREVLWPPVKTQGNFDKLHYHNYFDMKKGEIPTEKWQIYKIKKVVFTTGKSNITLPLKMMFVIIDFLCL